MKNHLNVSYEIKREEFNGAIRWKLYEIKNDQLFFALGHYARFKDALKACPETFYGHWVRIIGKSRISYRR